MARIRYIKPEYFENEGLAEVSLLARYLYIGLFCHLDRTGVAPYSPRLLKAKIFPFDDAITSEHVKAALEELIKSKHLRQFMHDGAEMLYCPTFQKHQLFHKNERAKYKLSQEEIEALCEHRTSTVQAPVEYEKELVIGNGERVIGNGELVTGISENVSDPPPKPKRSKKPKDSLESVDDRRRLKDFWLRLFKARFGHDYADSKSAFFNSTIKRLHDAFGGEKAAEYMRIFVAWNDPKVLGDGHALHKLLPNIHRLEAHRHRPQQLYSSIAKGKAQERVLTDSEQRLEEMRAYAQQQQESTTAIPLDHGDREPVGWEFQDSTQTGIPFESSGPSDESEDDLRAGTHGDEPCH